MNIRMAVWEGDNEHIVYEGDVNWGEDALRYKSVVRDIINDAVKEYHGFDKPVALFTIDIWDQQVADAEQKRFANGV